MSDGDEQRYKPPKLTATTVSFGLMRWILPIAFGGGIAYAMVKDLPKEQKRLSAKQDAQAVTLNNHDKKISLIERDIKYILDGINDIKGSIRRRRGRSRTHESPRP